MTSLSRRKRQITASVIRRKTKHSLARARRLLVAGLLGLAIVLTVLAGFADAQQGDREKFYRPPSVAPPVHAVPTGQYRPADHLHYRRPRPQQVRRPVQHTYPVRHAGAYQQADGNITDRYLNQVDQTMQETSDQWRTRSDQANQEAGSFLRSAAERNNNADPWQNQTTPQKNWDGRGMSEVAMPNTEIPQDQIGDATSQYNYEIPAPRNQRSFDQPGQVQPPQMMQQNDSRDAMPQEQSLNDQAPAMEDYTTDPFAAEATSENVAQDFEGNRGQSVLVRDEPLTQESPVVDNTASENSLRGMQVQPRRLRDTRGARSSYGGRNRYRNSSNTRSQDEFDLGQEDDLLDNNDDDQSRGRKSCDEYRTELLNTPITDIVLDISALRPSVAAQKTPAGLTRTWTDCRGTALATGTLIGLERSYIVVNDESGQGRLIPMMQLSDSDLLVVSEFWGLPSECSLGCDSFLGRCWMPNTFFWKASALCHKPLYFENRQMERYGHTHGPIVEPIHSTVHFFTSLILWPYNTGINPPNECLYALGFYRPGDCAPWLKEPLPISFHGAVNQGIAIGAAGAIIP